MGGPGGMGGRAAPHKGGSGGGLPPEANTASYTSFLSTWHQLLDSGRMQDGEPSLAGTARPVVARMSAATAAQAGLADGDKVTVATEQGSVTVPVEVVSMADHVVWLPAAGLNPGPAGPAAAGGSSTIRAELGAGHGATVTLRRPE